MTSTSVFYGPASTMTVHMPPGSAEAVLMIEALDNVASITLSIDEILRLISTLQVYAETPARDGFSSLGSLSPAPD